MQNKETIIKISDEFDGARLDKVLSKHFPDVGGFAFMQTICRKGLVKVNGTRKKKSEFKVSSGDEIAIHPSVDLKKRKDDTKKKVKLDLTNAEKKSFTDSILYQDDAIMVINKPAGLPVQAGTGQIKSIDRILKAIYPTDTPKLVHRLDKDTTGCLVLAKTAKVATKIVEQFKAKDLDKTYHAVAYGDLAEPSGTIDFNIGKELDQETGKERMFVGAKKRGKEAVTHYERYFRKGKYHFLRVNPETGRTHQIRVHLSAIGTPIIGDFKYGDKDINKGELKDISKHLFLHAFKITFTHPTLNKKMDFIAPEPEHFKKLEKKLGR